MFFPTPTPSVNPCWKRSACNGLRIFLRTSRLLIASLT